MKFIWVLPTSSHQRQIIRHNNIKQRTKIVPRKAAAVAVTLTNQQTNVPM